MTSFPFLQPSVTAPLTRQARPLTAEDGFHCLLEERAQLTDDGRELGVSVRGQLVTLYEPSTQIIGAECSERQFGKRV